MNKLFGRSGLGVPVIVKCKSCLLDGQFFFWLFGIGFAMFAWAKFLTHSMTFVSDLCAWVVFCLFVDRRVWGVGLVRLFQCLKWWVE